MTVPGGEPLVGRSRRPGQDGVVALELALVLPLVALLLVAGLGLAGVVRTALVAQEAARLGARVAAVDHDDTAVRRAVHDVVGPTATVTVDARVVHRPVQVVVAVPADLLGLRHTVSARATALVEPVAEP